MVVHRERKSQFVRLFDKTAPSIRCPHFYELILSNGCPFDCSYCYLKLTFRGNTEPTLFTNRWDTVKDEIDGAGNGVFSTGELADSLAVEPPLLDRAIDYFSTLDHKFLLLVTKSANVKPLLNRSPSDKILLSFSVNSVPAASRFERAAPNPIDRLTVAEKMINLGWRVRLRLDPIILETDLRHYQGICRQIAKIKPERVTIGTLRQFPTLSNFLPQAPKESLSRSSDGRLRYPFRERIATYSTIADWLGFQPSLCKETYDVWEALGWEFDGCNCTP